MCEVMVDVTPSWWDPNVDDVVEYARRKALFVAVHPWTHEESKFMAHLSKATSKGLVQRDRITVTFKADHGIDLKAFRAAFIDRLESPGVKNAVLGATASAAAGRGARGHG